jgi:hypothetical protein
MKMLFAKRKLVLPVSAFAVAGLLASTTISNSGNEKKVIESCNNTALSHVCIMKTVFGLDTIQDGNLGQFETPEKVEAAIKKGLEWTDKAQSNDGGWGAGTHAQQGVLDPHAVPSDPATTSMVAMSLLRTDNTLQKGEYSKNLKKATEFLLKSHGRLPG